MKKIIKRIVIIFAIICAILFSAFAIFFIAIGIEVITKPQDITDIPRSYSFSFTPSVGSSSQTEEETELQWYDTLEEALQNDELIEEQLLREGNRPYNMNGAVELLQIQEDDRLAIFYDTMPTEEDVVGDMVYILVEVAGGKYSQPYYRGRLGNQPGYFTDGNPDYIYDCDDSVVFYIEQEFLLRNSFGMQEGQIPVCFGMWDDQNEIESLTVDGRSPQIIPVVIDEKTCYFWYFEDLEWIEKLNEINWGGFTYGEVIDVLQIKYIKTESETEGET